MTITSFSKQTYLGGPSKGMIKNFPHSVCVLVLSGHVSAEMGWRIKFRTGRCVNGPVLQWPSGYVHSKDQLRVRKTPVLNTPFTNARITNQQTREQAHNGHKSSSLRSVICGRLQIGERTQDKETGRADWF